MNIIDKMTRHDTPIENPTAYRAAVRRNIIANALKTWKATTPRATEILEAVEAGRYYENCGYTYTDDFIGSMARAVDNFGKLTQKQSDAILRGIDARAARKAEWADKKAALAAKRDHVGVVGEKITLTLTITHIVSLDSVYGVTFIYIMEDGDKNVVIYKGNSNAIMLTPEHTLRAKGDSFIITADVKEHGVRDGVKQTIIQRPKKYK